ncbi:MULTISPECIES: winged helix-turn-helix domain-containing protein [Variovorax]|uniref:winged helix-turn-helix domain-containing protein n=1 Tax=Variovorax TaxID=34072 RepID=UPI00286171E8|nr:winged helix-turn-helix domain-containing protein [Variovorax sp. 3319]MDR6890691.1 DNA-binding winged helix-turn-helix (wHTH) protein [Variovorax sp. 3319]
MIDAASNYGRLSRMSNPTTAATIALIECEKSGDAALQNRLRRLGHFVVPFTSASDFLTAAREGIRFDLLLTPLLPVAPWHAVLDACARTGVAIILLASEPQMPALAQALVTAKEQFMGRVEVNFATVPVTDMELGCWVGLLSRPGPALAPPPRPQNDRTFGAYKLNVLRRKAFIREQDAKLTPREFEVALLLFENANRVLERGILLKTVWGAKAGFHRSRVLDVCISNLRRKLHLCESNGVELIPIYRRGYQLRRFELSAHEDTLIDRSLFISADALPRALELA